MKFSADFRKRSVWVPTLILGAILAYFTVNEFKYTKDNNFLFIHITLSFVALVAFMLNTWLPVLFAAIFLPFGMGSLLGPNRFFGLYADHYFTSTIHLDTSIFILTIFSFIVFSYIYQPLEKRLPRVLKFLLAIIIIFVGFFILPSSIVTLLRNYSKYKILLSIPQSLFTP